MMPFGFSGGNLSIRSVSIMSPYSMSGAAVQAMGLSMNAIRQVSEYRFPNIDFPVAILRASLDEIAERFGLKIEAWEESGLGPARGMFIGIPSGRIMLLRELEHAIKHLGEAGPTVSIEAGAMAALGVQPLIDEVLDGLGLSADAVAWRPSDDVRGHAAESLTRIAHLNR